MRLNRYLSPPNNGWGLGLGLWYLMPLSTIFQLYRMTVSFTGGGNQRKPLTYRKSLTNFTHIMLHRVHLAMIA